MVNIRRGFHQSLFDQTLHDGTAQAFHIHGIPADKVCNIPAQLCRTLSTGAAQESAIFILFHLCAADRTVCRQEISFRSFGTFGKVHLQNFRNDLSGLPDQNRITNADIPLGDEVLIVQCGIGHGGSRQTHSLHHSFRGQHSGTSHLDHDILHHCGLNLRRILICHSPSGALCGAAHAAALGQVIHFYHRTVDVTGKFIPVFIDGCNSLQNRIRVRQCHTVNDLEFQSFQIVKGFAVCRKGHTLAQLGIENVDIQAAAGSNLRIQLTQRAGSCIPRIGKERFSLLFLTLVELFEALFRHEHLAPDNESGRGIFQGHGNGADGL